nr:sulfite reductase flavoprotein subunit alpha [Pseudoxanthomonas sp.]
MSRRAETTSFTFAALGNLLVFAVLLVAVIMLARLQGEGWWLAAPRSGRWFAAGAVLLAYAGAWGWLAARQRRGEHGNRAAASTDALRVVYASQTGFAHVLANRTAESLIAAGVPTQVQAIDGLQAGDLAQGRILFVVSTTGEGDPPDHAMGFVHRVMSQPAALHGLHYAVLALGDREYTRFCAFGHQLDDWLRQHGAQPLFDRVDVDNADESALRHWQHHLGQLGGTTDLPDWDRPRYEDWILAERRCLNPGSMGQPAFHLALRPLEGTLPSWQAGDIAEIGPRNPLAAVAGFIQATGWDPQRRVDWQGAPQSLADVLAQVHLPDPAPLRGSDVQMAVDGFTALPHREYSIASVPADGALHLLVRRMLRPDGSPGLGSGWLCEHAAPGGTISLRIRENVNFHAPSTDRPLILIGNGTGIAGLRAHLKARIANAAHRNWLVFGERQAAHDFFHREELLAWQAQGALNRLDLAFSRDLPGCRYVQDALRDAGDELRQWVDAGAAIYVCGSLEGMAPGVDAALRDLLGAEALEQLRLDGRYRRDVY